MEIDDESVDIFWGGVSPGDHKWHFQGTQECQLNWHEIAVSRENCTRECILMTSIPSEMIRKISFPTLFAAGSIVRHFEEVQVPPVEQKNSLGYTASIGRDPLLNWLIEVWGFFSYTEDDMNKMYYLFYLNWKEDGY